MPLQSQIPPHCYKMEEILTGEIYFLNKVVKLCGTITVCMLTCPCMHMHACTHIHYSLYAHLSIHTFTHTYIHMVISYICILYRCCYIVEVIEWNYHLSNVHSYDLEIRVMVKVVELVAVLKKLKSMYCIVFVFHLSHLHINI